MHYLGHDNLESGPRQLSVRKGSTVTAHYRDAPSQRHRIGVGGTAFVSEGVEVHLGRCDLAPFRVSEERDAKSLGFRCDHTDQLPDPKSFPKSPHKLFRRAPLIGAISKA